MFAPFGCRVIVVVEEKFPAAPMFGFQKWDADATGHEERQAFRFVDIENVDTVES